MNDFRILVPLKFRFENFDNYTSIDFHESSGVVKCIIYRNHYLNPLERLKCEINCKNHICFRLGTC